MSELIIKENKIESPETLSLKSEAPTPSKAVKLEKVELSKNIQAFDKKPRVFTENPFSFNAVAKRQAEKRMEQRVEASPTATQMITDPLYNRVGKSLGVDTIHEWGLNYDKVYEIVELAKQKSGITDPNRLAEWIYNRTSQAPSLGSKRINDVYIYLKMAKAPQTKTKTIIKTIVKHVKPKETTEQFVSKWMGGLKF